MARKYRKARAQIPPPKTPTPKPPAPVVPEPKPAAGVSQERRRTLRASVATYDNAAAAATKELRYLISVGALEHAVEVFETLVPVMEELEARGDGTLNVGHRMAIVAARIEQERKWLKLHLKSEGATSGIQEERAQVAEVDRLDAEEAEILVDGIRMHPVGQELMDAGKPTGS